MKFIFSLFLSLLISPSVWAGSQCALTVGFMKSISCPSQTLEIKGDYLTRTVKFSLPQGTPPSEGWPAVIVYQGSFFSVDFTRSEGTPFGGFNEIRLIQNLLDHGFAVIAPPAINDFAWMTNLVGISYDHSEDEIFIQHLLANMEEGHFGPINMAKLFATGISSGGYNTSRMAISFPGVFKALAIESASYATCGGPLCSVPSELPANHPPTLFLHGQADLIVPINTMLDYHMRLKEAGIPTKVLVDPIAGHQWLDQAPQAITKWFLQSSSSSSTP